jgi:hypothetical protein
LQNFSIVPSLLRIYLIGDLMVVVRVDVGWSSSYGSSVVFHHINVGILSNWMSWVWILIVKGRVERGLETRVWHDRERVQESIAELLKILINDAWESPPSLSVCIRVCREGGGVLGGCLTDVVNWDEGELSLGRKEGLGRGGRVLVLLDVEGELGWVLFLGWGLSSLGLGGFLYNGLHSVSLASGGWDNDWDDLGWFVFVTSRLPVCRSEVLFEFEFVNFFFKVFEFLPVSNLICISLLLIEPLLLWIQILPLDAYLLHDVQHMHFLVGTLDLLPGLPYKNHVGREALLGSLRLNLI